MASTSKPDTNLETLYDLIEELCVSADIHEILKDTKFDLPKERKKDILIGGNKEDKISNLRRAVNEGILPVEKAYDLLREAEENGRQHILYFVPKNLNSVTAELRADRVAAKLWGKGGAASMGFPRFTKLAPQLMWADFRTVTVADTNYQGWWLKAYDTAVRRELVETERKGDTRIIETYDIVQERVVYIIRWHSYGLLEVRLPAGYSAKVRQQMYDNLMLLTGGAVPTDAFAKWDLASARAKMLREYLKNLHIYKLSSTEAMDAAGYRTRLTPPSDEEVINNSDGQKEIVKVLIKEDASSEEIAVIWQPENSKIVREAFRSVLGSEGTNHAYLGARLRSREVDYVTNKLREFAA